MTSSLQVEELERVGLLTGPEVRELIKKRKYFEYKIQKRTKKKVGKISNLD